MVLLLGLGLLFGLSLAYLIGSWLSRSRRGQVYFLNMIDWPNLSAPDQELYWQLREKLESGYMLRGRERELLRELSERD